TPTLYMRAFSKRCASGTPRDRSRAVAPLEPAEDAILLDTSDLNADEVFAKALDIIQK
ncbi:MAG: (d)CMP kinase, partial [Alphaproteobacteria bacterium]